MGPRALVSALALVATLGTGVAAAEAGPNDRSPELLLSWDAPYGSRGAKTGLVRECGDSTLKDTLYLSYRLAEGEPVFSGIVGTVVFLPQFEDSLAEFWNIEGHNPPFMRVEFPSDTNDAFRAGWKAKGVGGYRFFPDPKQGMLRLIFAVPAHEAQPIGAGTYSFARVIINRPVGSERCDQGLCVEFRDAKFSYSINQVSVRGEQTRASFATVNSPSGIACAKYRRLSDERRAALEAAIQMRRQATQDSASGR